MERSEVAFIDGVNKIIRMWCRSLGNIRNTTKRFREMPRHLDMLSNFFMVKTFFPELTLMISSA